ncbi:hypothetical protein VPNG_08862 [Cytospora leucostoma]|uniref:Uncharacterized protein n=1 Tax=Cytospora leucostoma TaxID=1230097 RepID=A0A423VRS7_9PEZI|nr:hypothetical protein VPNG_08862 [Cytospora leucostoma]
MDMEGRGNWENLYNCLGRRHGTNDQSVELTLQRNLDGRTLTDRSAEDMARRGNALGSSQAGLPRPFPRGPSTRGSTNNLGRPRRPLQIPSEPAKYEKDTVPAEDEREYDNAWHQMLESLHNALKHTRYAVSGRMAMAVWGCDRGARDARSVICPIDFKEAVMIWAASTGGPVAISDAEPDILTCQAQGSSSRSLYGGPYIWRIRLRWMPEKVFEKMPQIEKTLTYNENPYTGDYRTACVNVLTLPAILDNCASAWANNLAKGASHERLDAVAEDIFSILDRIMDLNFHEIACGPLSANECRHILGSAFWGPFTQCYPQAQAAFAACALGLPPCTQPQQPVAHDGMVYPEALPVSTSSANGHPARHVGRSLLARRPVPGLRSEAATLGTPVLAGREMSVCASSPGHLSSDAIRTEAKADPVGRERRGKGDSSQSGESVARGSQKTGERRKRVHRVHYEAEEGRSASKSRVDRPK